MVIIVPTLSISESDYNTEITNEEIKEATICDSFAISHVMDSVENLQSEMDLNVDDTSDDAISPEKRLYKSDYEFIYSAVGSDGEVLQLIRASIADPTCTVVVAGTELTIGSPVDLLQGWEFYDQRKPDHLAVKIYNADEPNQLTSLTGLHFDIDTSNNTIETINIIFRTI